MSKEIEKEKGEQRREDLFLKKQNSFLFSLFSFPLSWA
jgi:hypothetical protein